MPRQLQLDDRLYAYLVDHSLRDHPALAALREATKDLKWAMMQIGPDQGQFMQIAGEAHRRAQLHRDRRLHRLQLALGGACTCRPTAGSSPAT